MPGLFVSRIVIIPETSSFSPNIATILEQGRLIGRVLGSHVPQVDIKAKLQPNYLYYVYKMARTERT